MQKIKGFYHFLAGYPNLMGKIPFYRWRWNESLQMNQVKIKYLGSFQWINVNKIDLEFCED